MNFGDRKMQMSSEAVPPMRTSPISRPPSPASASATTSSPTPRDALTSTTSPGADQLARPARRPPRASATACASPPNVSSIAAERGPTAISSVDARRRRVRADLLVVLALGRPELEHVAEHRDAPSGGFLHGEIVQGGTHGQRVGVVAVVDDGCAAGERDALAAQRAEAHVDAPARAARRPPARRPPRPACCAGCGASRTAARARSAPPPATTTWRSGRASGTRPPRSDAPSKCTSPPGPNVTTSSASRRYGSSSGSSDGTTATRAVAHPHQQLRLGARDALERAHLLEVDRPDVRDHADVGLADRGQLGDLAEAAHRQLQHEHLGARRRREQLERQPDLGVEVRAARRHGAVRRDRAPRSGPWSTSCRPSR